MSALQTNIDLWQCHCHQGHGNALIIGIDIAVIVIYGFENDVVAELAIRVGLVISTSHFNGNITTPRVGHLGVTEVPYLTPNNGHHVTPATP